MFSALLASIFLTALPPSPSDTEQSAYQTARDHAGRDPEAHVKLALWCERHGMDPERLRHLTLAVMADPQNTTARGLLGMVKDRDGHWVKTQQAVNPDHQDPQLLQALGDYNQKRASIDDHDPDDHWKLALWCDEHGLNAEARAHFAAVVRLQPSRDAAWKRLGCKKVNGRWMTEVQAAAEKAEREAQAQDDDRWGKLLKAWKGGLSGPRTRDAALTNLKAVSDPRAVPSVWRIFVVSGHPDHLQAVQLLGQIDAITSSRALATIAVFSPSEEAGRRAIETLRQRDPREFANLLISLIRKPLKYEVRPVGGPGSPGALFIEGERVAVQRLYRPPSIPNFSWLAGDSILPGPDGLPVAAHVYSLNEGTYRHQVLGSYTYNQLTNLHPTDPSMAAPVGAFQTDPQGAVNTMFQKQIAPNARNLWFHDRAAFVDNPNIQFDVDHDYAMPISANFIAVPIGRIALEYQKTAVMAENQLERDVASVERANQQIKTNNQRIADLLLDSTGVKLEADPESWSRWWNTQLGYSYQENRPTAKRRVVQDVPLQYTPHPVAAMNVHDQITGVMDRGVNIHLNSKISCFGAGTPVHTLAGIRPIEDLQVGDLVLSQNTRTGTLGYQPVLVTHHNPPSKTLVVNVGGEPVTASLFHRFWIAGKGWKMARELKTGDVIRTLDGLRSVDSIEPGQVQKVYNLDVAEGHSFFVAQKGVLVHDNSVPDLRARPFDQPAELAAADSTQDSSSRTDNSR